MARFVVVSCLLFQAGCMCGDHFCNWDGSDPNPDPEPGCGNGIVEAEIGEDCDSDSESCSNTCHFMGLDITYSVERLDGAEASGCVWAIPGLTSAIDRAVLTIQPLDAAGNPAGAVQTRSGECDTGSDDGELHVPSTRSAVGQRFRAWVELGDGGSDVWARMPTFDSTWDDQRITRELTIYEDAGYANLVWRLVGETSQSELTCETAGIDMIRIGGLMVSCAAGPQPIGPYSFGMHTVDAAALASGTEVATAQAVMDIDRLSDTTVMTIDIPGR